MSHVIPLHSLILCEQADFLPKFAPHEAVSLDMVCDQLVGAPRRHDLRSIILAELRHRVALKLSLGERVVVQTDGLNQDQRRQLVSLATSQGADVYAIGHTEDNTECRAIEFPTFETVAPLSGDGARQLRDRHWLGITVVGDVHGEVGRLREALEWARSRSHFVWLLGDVVDYGKQTLETVDVVHDAVMRGEAAMVLANHERKIARWLNREGDNLRISDGNRVTITALERLSSRDRNRWIGRFRALLAHTALLQQFDDLTLAHAAVHPSLWSAPEQKAVEHYAVYGESDHCAGYYRRTHRWIDAVPAGQMVIVGHEIVAEYPMVCTGAKGGKVVFLDTGCGKGGVLSSADLRFTPEGLRLECFKRH